MKYTATVNGRTYEVEIERTDVFRPLTREEIAAGAVVLVRAEHPSVISEPLVMHRRKIELRDRLQTQPSQPLKFCAQFLYAPRSLNGNVGSAFVLHPFIQIDEDHIIALCGHPVGYDAPFAIVARKRIASFRAGGYVHPQMDKIGNNALFHFTNSFHGGKPSRLAQSPNAVKVLK